MTDEGILIRREGGEWHTPHVDSYDNESHLQSLIHKSPSRVPGVSDQSMAVTEMGTSGGPIDVCIVGPDGSVTVVECKLASNSERRRMVLGQVIDYAAAVWHDGIDAFLDSWERAGGPRLQETLDPTAFDQLRRNVADVRINLCLAVDRIDSDLRRLVEYLNLSTRVEITVTALQLSYAREGDLEILIPSTFGAEIAASKTHPTRQAVAWTWDSFVAEMHDAGDRAAADRLYQLLQGSERRGTHELLWFGARPNGGVFFHPYGLRYAPFQLWINAAGQLMLYGNWNNWQIIRGHEGFAELAKFLGQDHLGSQRSVPVSSLDLDRLWAIALRCAEAINEVASTVPQPSTSPQQDALDALTTEGGGAG